MSKQSETMAHNLEAVGAECPKCGGGVNPAILANFGHCLACLSASVGLRPFRQG